MPSQFVQKVVQNCLRIGEDDYVMIFAWRHMLELAEAFALGCQKSGACIHLQITNDELWYDSILHQSIDYLETPDPFQLASAGFVTAAIYISAPENPERMKEVSAERWMAISRADKPVYEKFLKRKVRIAQINLGLVTPQRAKTYGFDYQVWKKNVEDAIDVEYEEMQKLGRKVADALEKAQEVKVTSPDGMRARAHIKNGHTATTNHQVKISYTYLS
jgi:leucyl aminopeptidase (aminopeptidase T)